MNEPSTDRDGGKTATASRKHAQEAQPLRGQHFIYKTALGRVRGTIGADFRQRKEEKEVLPMICKGGGVKGSA